MTSSRPALVTAMLLTMSLVPGCLDNVADETDSQTETAATTVSSVMDTASSLPNPLRSYQLVSVSVTDRYSDSSTFTRSALFSYLSPLDNYAKKTWVSDKAVVSMEEPTAAQMTAVLPPLTLSIDPGDHGALNQTLDLVTALAQTPTANATISYWLSAMSGSPVWTVTTTYLDNGTSARRFWDVDADITMDLNTTAPSPGIPPLPAVNSPDIPFSLAETVAASLATAWSTDSFTYAVVGIEGGQPNEPVGTFKSVGFAHESTPSIFVPPDLAPADGKVAVWGFLYYSPSRHQLLPIYVYASVAAVLGTPVVPFWSDYTSGSIDVTDVVDSTAVAAHLRPPLSGRFADAYVIEQNPDDYWLVKFDSRGEDRLLMRADGEGLVLCNPGAGCVQ